MPDLSKNGLKKKRRVIPLIFGGVLAWAPPRTEGGLQRYTADSVAVDGRPATKRCKHPRHTATATLCPKKKNLHNPFLLGT